MAASIALRTGAMMPSVGLGTWKAPVGVVATAVEDALKAGYRHLDCACDYGNEKEVGAGIAAAISGGVCTREEIFVTSKLWCTYHRGENVKPACERTLSDLGLAYVDLYLIHFPISLKFVPFEERYPPEWFFDPKAENPKAILDPVPVSETWAAMESLVDAGMVKAIGVSNFNAQLLVDLMSYAKIKPAVNQIEIHPYNTQDNLVRLCKDMGVVVTGFSPLGAGSYVEIGGATVNDSVLNVASVKEIAQKYGKSPAQVVLRWAVQRGNTVVPKSANADRIKQNISLFDFELTEDEMASVSGLNKNRRFNDPGVFCEGAFSMFCPIHA